MEELFISPVFRYLIFPLGSTALGIGIKYATKNDQFSGFSKEDLAVGLDLMRTATLMFVILTTDKAIALVKANTELSRVLSSLPINAEKAYELQGQAQNLSSQFAASGWLIALMVLALWSVSTIVRKKGWKSKDEMTPFTGIALPLAFGILALAGVMAGASR